MRSGSRRFFLLKFGRQQAGIQRVEVRNDSFELLGTCFAEDFQQISRLMSHFPLDERVLSDIQAIQHGKITLIAL
ncbi:MAG: hypothetical protein RLZZ519_2335 [Bacteroidota bacterium]|jgi:hypothetical protein